MGFRPLHDRVLVEPLEADEKTAGGIVLPDTAKEKPKQPKTNLAVIGSYMYDGRVFDVIKQQKPSDRGELEITDVNNWYIQDGSMTYEVLEGWWTDAGTFESLHAASKLVAEGGANHTE